MAEKMRYCPNCGFTIPAGVKFCPNCGMDLVQFDARLAAQSATQQTQSRPTMQQTASDTTRAAQRETAGRSRRQQEKTGHVKKSLVLTDDSFQHFLDWLATHIVYTLIGVLVLFCVFSFSVWIGWLLAVISTVGVYVVANRRVVAPYQSKFSAESPDDDDIWTMPRSAATGQGANYTAAAGGQSTSSPWPQGMTTNGPQHWWTRLAGKPRRRGGVIWIAYLLAAFVALIAAYAWPFGASGVGTTAVGGSLYDLVRSANTLAETAAAAGTVSSAKANLPYLALVLAGLGPALGLLFGFFRSRGMMRLGGVLGLLGYASLYFAYAPLMSSGSNQIQGLLSPGIGYSIGIGAALVMFVTAWLLPRD
ncbi:membrane protein [Lacticaseibacillus casei]|nr:MULTISPECIES: zinc ribbon domain-containing protein [Lacticaseibacillus]KLI76011.1 membrane protein [Lacticaseibacillus casei]